MKINVYTADEAPEIEDEMIYRTYSVRQIRNPIKKAPAFEWVELPNVICVRSGRADRGRWARPKTSLILRKVGPVPTGQLRVWGAGNERTANTRRNEQKDSVSFTEAAEEQPGLLRRVRRVPDGEQGPAWLTPIVVVLLLVGVLIFLSGTAAALLLYSHCFDTDCLTLRDRSECWAATSATGSDENCLR